MVVSKMSHREEGFLAAFQLLPHKPHVEQRKCGQETVAGAAESSHKKL